MNKQELVKDMKQYIGGSFITTTQLTKYMGYKKTESVKSIVEDLSKFSGKYFIPEVAERILENEKID